MTSRLVVTPVLGVPDVRAGDDLAALLAGALRGVAPPAVLVVSSKVVSKSLGLSVTGQLRGEVVAAQSVRVVAERMSGGDVTQVVEAVAGPVMAAAGVDASNTGAPDTLLVLPEDADAAARALLGRLREWLELDPDVPLGVVVSDTAGRPWRTGLTDFALGCAGVRPLLDHRGEPDTDGRVMGVTVRALADELAAAADLVKGKALGVPAAVVSGLDRAWFDPAAPGARSLVRTGPGDWFALGHVEAVRAALGVPPGSPASRTVGLPSAGALDPFGERVTRVVALALHDVPSGAIDVDPFDAGPVPGRAAEARLTCSARDDVETGVLLARVLVAAHAETLDAHRTGPRNIQLVEAAR